MSRWPRDNQAELLKFYGTPGRDVERQLVAVIPPFKMYYDGKPIKAIQFHKKAAAALRAALDEIWEHYDRDQAKIDTLGISKYAGSYNPRKVRGSATKWSNHAYGAAIDLNAKDNGFGKGKGNIPQPVIDAFKRQGARWGGDYKGRTDPMHFEFCDAGTAQPVALMTQPDDPGVHGDDGEAEQKPGFFSRARNWVVGAASGVGLGGLGYLTDWQIAVALFAFILILIGIALTVFFIIFDAEDVRAWVKRNVT